MIREVQRNSVYRHYKGKFYYILEICYHTETYETLVVYHALNSEGDTYARPLEIFISVVEEGVNNPTGQQYKFELFEDEE
ncbi:hypothetical protein JOC34_000560 [Virgibacillus halotolerans]|uniref:DUF1653 domain-containing protein n=1 Tax=Virgibacillus halotolerans TaxID=1071053 RepID=UPI001961EFDB|nr:DUF1653 domain-containing protein [Virgibacillus halotolerans]MBM7598203.1 hypothetical protein [Virgibacillus halotolerans]